MAYFTTKQGYFFLCSDISSEEKRKLDDFLLVLEESGVGRIIEDADDRKGAGGRPSYNPYRMFATILYAFLYEPAVFPSSPHSIPNRKVRNRAKRGAICTDEIFEYGKKGFPGE